MAPVPTARLTGAPAAALVGALVRRLAGHEPGLVDRVMAMAWGLSTGAILELLRAKVAAARSQAGSVVMVRGHDARVAIRRVAVVRCHDHPVASAADRHHYPAMAGEHQNKKKRRLFLVFVSRPALPPSLQPRPRRRCPLRRRYH